MQHLTEEQISRYVDRSLGVDDLLASAEHLDRCFECRDRAAAFADPGIGTPSHTRRKRSGPRPPAPEESRRSRIAAIALAALTIVVVIAIVWLASQQ